MRVHILFRLLLEPRVSIAVTSFDMGMVCNLSSLPDHKFHEWDILDMLMMILFRLPEMFFYENTKEYVVVLRKEGNEYFPNFSSCILL